jgi:hypothetical protein
LTTESGEGNFKVKLLRARPAALFTLALFMLGGHGKRSPSSPIPQSEKSVDSAQHNAQVHKLLPERSSAAGYGQDATPKNVNGENLARKARRDEFLVHVESFPPRTAFDYVAVISTVVLTLVGICGTLVALCTLRVIAHQTKATEEATVAANRSAEAAGRNIEVLISIERPWIIVDIGKIPEFTPDPNKLEILWISATFENKGRTAARVLRYSMRDHQILRGDQLPEEPQYEKPVTVDLVLGQDSPMQPATVGMPGADFADIWTGKKKLYMYGYVDYLDLAGTERQTRFCYRYRVPRGFFPGEAGFYIATDAPTPYWRFT